MIDPRSLALLQALLRDGPATFTALRGVVRNPCTLSAKLKGLVGIGWAEVIRALIK